MIFAANRANPENFADADVGVWRSPAVLAGRGGAGLGAVPSTPSVLLVGLYDAGKEKAAAHEVQRLMSGAQERTRTSTVLPAST